MVYKAKSVCNGNKCFCLPRLQFQIYEYQALSKENQCLNDDDNDNDDDDKTGGGKRGAGREEREAQAQFLSVILRC